MTPDLLDCIEDKFTVGDGCWEWTASLSAAGYGQLTINGRGGQYAHRELYQFMVGLIPKGKELDHLCENKRCIRPDHLEPVTHAENLRRHWSNHPRTHCLRGHPLVVGNLNVDNRGRRECLTCKRRRGRDWARRHSST